ncbi:hypothetical protein J7L48_07170, partial [bacterium]|nr:hypothetical protein [bacterium]
MKNMRSVFVILIFFVAVSTISSSDHYNIYLKNKNIFYGELLELIPNESVTIKTLGRNILCFKWEDIEKIKKVEETNIKNVERTNNKGIYGKFKKLHLLFNLFGFETENIEGCNFSMEFPFKKNKYGFFFAEFGFLADNSLFSMLNITLGYKIFDTSKSISPIFSGGLGYYLSGDGYYSNESGLLIDLKIGLNLLNAKYGVFQLLLGLKTYYYRYGYSTCNTIYENCDAIWHTTSESEYIFTYGVA